MIPTSAALLLAGAALLLGEAPAGAALPPGGPKGQEALSDEFRKTRWAHPVSTAQIRTWPSIFGKTITHLRLTTEDDFPEVYLVLSTWTDDEGREWVRIRVPMRPNGRTGWVTREALGEYRTTTSAVRIDRRSKRLTVFRNGRAVFRARVGVGKRSTPTPGGRYYVREKFRVRSNQFLYGTHAIGTSAYAPKLTDWPNGGVVGMHGTGQPHLIPGRPSNGCIRLRNRDVRRLYGLVGSGTPIRIL